MQSRCAVVGEGRCVVPCVSGHKCLPRRSGRRSFSPLGAGKQPWRCCCPGGFLRAPLCWENQEFLWLRSKVLAEAARFLVPPAVTAGLSHHQRFFNSLLRFKVSKPTSVRLSSGVQSSSLLLSIRLPPSRRPLSQHRVCQSRRVFAIWLIPPKMTFFFMQCRYFLDVCSACGFRCYPALSSAVPCPAGYSPSLFIHWFRGSKGGFVPDRTGFVSLIPDIAALPAKLMDLSVNLCITLFAFNMIYFPKTRQVISKTRIKSN